jgi:hypothetical protein
MSVLFLPPSAGAASVPDASETVKGKIRIATSAEATAGTDDLTSMTPAKVKSVVDAAVAGGVTYKGTFDAASPLDLSNAVQGDLYIIDGAGTYQGKTWAVGDHLLVNADMGGTVDPAKIDKIDSTDSVTSVAGRTGAVVLSTADISGLATVATSGAYSDLSGTPSLATVATTGAYSDLSGTPSLATVATTGAYSDLSGTPDIPDFQTITVNSNTTLSSSLEDGCYLIMIGSAATVTIPAYPTGKSLVFRFVSFGAGTCTIQQASGGNRLYEFGNSGITGVNSVNVASGATRTFHLWAAGSTVALNYWSEASPSSTSATVAALDDIGDVDTTGVSTNNVLKYDGANWVDGSVAYSEVTGTPSLATIATTGDYSDLNDSVVVQQFNANATASAISSNALHIFRFYGAGGFTLSLSTSTALNGFALFNNISGSDVTVNGGTFRANGEGVTGGSSSITVKAGERRLYYVEGVSLYLESNSTLIGHNADVTITSPSNGEALIYNSASGDWENGTVSATVAALNDVGDVTITTPANTQVIKYNSTSGDWENGAVAYADVSGTPTLGTAAALDVGTSANNVVQLNGSAQLPAVDGSQLTGISATVAALNDIGDVSAAAPNNGDVIAYNSTSGDWEAAAQSVSAPSVTVSSPATDQTLSAPTGIEEAYIYTPSAAITVNLIAAATAGSGFKYHIKNRSTNVITIDPSGSEAIDGQATFDLTVQESSVSLICDGSNWFII